MLSSCGDYANQANENFNAFFKLLGSNIRWEIIGKQSDFLCREIEIVKGLGQLSYERVRSARSERKS